MLRAPVFFRKLFYLHGESGGILIGENTHFALHDVTGRLSAFEQPKFIKICTRLALRCSDTAVLMFWESAPTTLDQAVISTLLPL